MALRYPSHKISSMERYVAESVTAISGSGTTTIPLTDRVLVRISLSDDGNFDLEAGSEDGQYRILIVETITPTSTQKIENSTNVQLVDRAWLPESAGEMLGLIWNATNAKWFEKFRSINYDSTTGIYVKNETGSTISRGKVVRITGSTGNNPLIDLADNTLELTSENTIGVVNDDIAHNAFGHVITNGLVKNVITTGLTAGDTLYLEKTGNFTATKPSAPDNIVKIGNVIRVGGATVGSIQVWISNGWELEELHNVAISSPVNNEVLTYESATQLWKNKPAGGGSSPAIGGAITGGTAGSVLFVDPAATIAQDNANLFYDNTNNILILGGTSASTTDLGLEVKGAGSGLMSLTDTNNTSSNGSVFARYIGRGWNGSSTQQSRTELRSVYEDTVGGSQLRFMTSNGSAAHTTNMTLTGAGDLGIGTTSPSAKLAVGASSEFRVNSTGNITRINNIATSFPASQGAASTFLQNDGAGNLTWAAAGGGISDGDKGDITVSSSGTVWTIDNTVVTNAKLANMATSTFKGRTTAGTGTPEDLTATQATAILNTFTSVLKGLVPASGGGTTNFLRADGTWAAAGGGADPWTYVILGSNFTANATAPVAVTDLFFTPAANTRYEIFGQLLLRTATATVGPRPGVNPITTGVVDSAYYIDVPNSNTALAIRNQGATTAGLNAASTGVPTTTDTYLSNVIATLITNASPSGNWQITLASETAGTIVTMRAGSFIKYRTY